MTADNRSCRYTTTFGCDATYGPTSNILLYEKPPRQIPAPLQELLEVVQAATGAEYNFLLMNYYEVCAAMPCQPCSLLQLPAL